MAKPVKFTLPKSDVDVLVDYFSLDKNIKIDLLKSLDSYTGDLTPRSITEFLFEKLKIDRKFLLEFADVFLNFIHSYDAYETTFENFVEQVKISILLVQSEFNFGKDEENDILGILKTGQHSQDRAKVLGLLTDNPNNYDGARIIQSLRTRFDEEGNIVGSAILHNLKITTYERGKGKDFYFALNREDLEALSDEIKKAQENERKIESAFEYAKIFDI